MRESKKAGNKSKQGFSKRAVQAQHNLIKKYQEHPTSKTKAIAAACYACFGGTPNEFPDPGWKDEIRKCTAKDTCPLYPHRPYRKK